MSQRSLPIGASVLALCELVEGQEADFFALLSEKQELKTRDGKPYHRVTFRDARREVGFPVWSDSPHAESCRAEWVPGSFYKMRAVLRQTTYGPQLEIKKIRLVEDGDKKDGFDPLMCQPASRFDAVEMFAELINLVESKIANKPLRKLVADILEQHREQLLVWPAAKRNHHAFVSGFLEHTLNVARNSAFLAEKYAELYCNLDPPVSIDLAIAGATLHDIGKLRELENKPGGTEYSLSGMLIGHVLQGRDIVRETAAGRKIDPDLLLRLEHIIVAHQRLPEWGSPKPPMTIEAMIVHHADDLDAKLQMIVCAFEAEASNGALTSKRNPMNQQFYPGAKNE